MPEPRGARHFLEIIPDEPAQPSFRIHEEAGQKNL
jgi:hypothetical protein